MSDPKTIVLTGGRAPVALDLARHFARAGHRVVAAESLAFPLTRASKCVARSVRVPPPRQRPEAFLEALERLVAEEQAALVVPTCEETFTVSRLIERGLPIFTSSQGVLARLHDKGRFAERASALGLPVPETHRLVSRNTMRPFRPDDWVLKPAFSRFGTEALVPPHAPTRLARIAPTPERPWVAQRFVPGRQVCTYSVAHAGRIVAHVAYATPFVTGHAGVWFRAVEQPAARAFAERLVTADRFTGQIAFDFVEDAAGGVTAIECNPRATSGLHLFRDASDFAEALLNPAAAPVEASGEDATLGLPMLAAGARHRFGPAWRAAFRSARDVVFDPADPLPTVAQGLTAATFLIGAARHRCSPLAATTRDIEWNGPVDEWA